MARGIGPTRNSNAVRNALRHCQRHPCVCLAEAINRLVDGHDTGQGWNKGILERIAAMLSPTADPPGTIRNGRDTWETHTEQLQGRKRGLENLVEEYNAQGCGGGGHAVVIDPAAVAAARRASIPTADDYWDRYPDRRPTSRTTPPAGPTPWQRIGYAVGGTLLIVGAGALVFVPVDGPFGEYAAGTAGVAAWGLAIQ